MKKTTAAALLAATVALTAFTAGCKDNKQWQDAAVQAFTKQNEVSNYAFSGKADLNLKPLAKPQSGGFSIANTLNAMLLKSSIAFKGVSSRQPVQLEADVTVSLQGGAQSYNIPLLIKDNKLYTSMPILNQADEYISIDLEEASKASGSANPLTAASMDTLNQMLNAALGNWVKAIDPSLFANTAQEKDAPPVISIKLEGKSGMAALAEFAKQWPATVDQWVSQNWINAAQAEQWKTMISSIASAELEKPGSIMLYLNNEGFIQRTVIDLQLLLKDSSGSQSSQSIKWDVALDQINGNPPITKEVPAKVLPLEDLLKRLIPAVSPAAAK
ncbi:hypothetical protein [Paenibacillus turpanensis]|uniref:hypothetical protein n=1 Tax=Paenibacillus turpanensis TaxID=2689078 RepID=UPI0014083BB3|nr:hypothetical protein [Paenibacillus turpanensis]